MKIQLVGPSYVQRSLPFDAQRTVNLIPLSDEQGSDVSSLLGSPGLLLFSTAGTGPTRGSLAASNNRAFVVSGSTLYELDSSGTATSRGTLSTSSGYVTIADNGFQLGICDGSFVYMFTYATNVFAVVTDPDLPTNPKNISFNNGYFIVVKGGTGQFYISGLYAGTTWAALDFASAESSPDELSITSSLGGNLVLFGGNTMEIWRNSGGSGFPFSRISGAAPVGTVSPFTVIAIDTSVYWVGNNTQGSGIVYAAQGFSPKRISTEAIEIKLQAAPSPELLMSWTYQQDGHAFLVITGGGLETSLCYDLTTGLWHERAYLNVNGNYETHLGLNCMFAFNKQLVGDRLNGNIYQLDINTYSDNGSAIQRKRVYTHLIDELQPVRYDTLQIGFESGTGLQTGQGSAPKCSLRVSRDGARTWSDYYTKDIGAVGKYGQQVKFRRLGIQQECTFEVSISEPVKVAITGSYLGDRR